MVLAIIMMLFPWGKLIDWVAQSAWRTVMLFVGVLPLDDGLDSISDAEVRLLSLPSPPPPPSCLVPVADGKASGIPVVKYQIKVHTGDKRGAGTDANVYIILHGDRGDTGKRPLESSGNNFERGKIDTFGVETLDVGELQKITIGHDGSGFGSGWFLDNVVVRDETLRNKEYKFQCGRWLDKVVKQYFSL